MNLVMLDIETTGLDPKADLILEVAAVKVDVNTLETEGFSYQRRLAHPPEAIEARLAGNAYVRRMHEQNGLLEDIRNNEVDRISPDALEWELGSFLGSNAVLCGYSVHFDRGFLLSACPGLSSSLSHRHIDVSTLRQLHKEWGTVQYGGQAVAHRALQDCLDALQELRFYRGLLWQRS